MKPQFFCKIFIANETWHCWRGNWYWDSILFVLLRFRCGARQVLFNEFNAFYCHVVHMPLSLSSFCLSLFSSVSPFFAAAFLVWHVLPKIVRKGYCDISSTCCSWKFPFLLKQFQLRNESECEWHNLKFLSFFFKLFIFLHCDLTRVCPKVFIRKFIVTRDISKKIINNSSWCENKDSDSVWLQYQISVDRTNKIFLYLLMHGESTINFFQLHSSSRSINRRFCLQNE
jgi:hypothetical protein